MWYRRLTCVALAALLATSAGCNIVSAFAYFLGPPRTQPAEFKLTPDRLAVLVEPARPGDENPVFLQSLDETLIEVFRDKKINTQLVPRDELLQLRQKNADFASWSLQRTARELKAKQVLHVRLTSLRLRGGRDEPLIEPRVEMRLKVIGADEPANKARLWPSAEEREGRQLIVERPPEEFVDAASLDTAARKLGYDAGQYIAMFFYEVDLESPTPRAK